MSSSPESGIPQSRSPRYPRFALPTAITYLRKLYEGAHRSLLDTDTAFRVMGFAGKSGASSTALGALRQYGLIEAPKGGVRVSHLGLSVLEPSSEDEYREAIHVAGNHPTVFAQLQSHFEGELPRSDEPIRSYLIRNLDFSRKGVDECISSLRETFAFLESERKPISTSQVLEELGLGAEAHPPVLKEERRALDRFEPERETAGDIVVVPLTRDCRVEMRFYGEVSERALAKLARYIELMKEDWAGE